MGKFFKDSYARTYAAKNMKNALDKLIEVLQSPEHVRRQVIGPTPKKSNTKQPKIPIETPAKTPLWMETSAPVAKHANGDSEKTTTPPSSDTSEKRRTMSGGSQSSRCSDSSSYVSFGRYYQIWARSLREYPLGGGSIRPVPAKYQQKTTPGAELEAGWSCVPCKPGYL